MKNRLNSHLAALLAVPMLLLGASQALAGGTDADTTISNSATLSYSVGTVAPPDITSTPATFKVDHKINPVVAMVNGIDVVPNGANYALKFTVTNAGNTKAAETLQLQLDTLASATDNFDMNTVRIFQDNGDGNFDIGTDNNITLNPYISLAKDGQATIFIVADTPPNGGGTAPVNANTATYDLIATAWDGNGAGGAALAADAGGDDKDVAENVFTDGDGPADGPTDGVHSATATYTVVTATLTINKVSAVVAGGTGYYIPGETVEYTITVSNGAGAATATDISVTDSVDAEIAAGRLAWVADSIRVTAPNINGGAEKALTDIADGDEGTFAGNTVTVNGIELAANQTATVKFQVTIQ